MNYVATGSPIPEPPLVYIRGLLAQPAAFDHAVGPESYLLTGLCSILCMLDADSMGRTSPPLAPTLAQMRRKLEALAGRSQDVLLGNSPPALTGCCGGEIVATEDIPQNLPGVWGGNLRKATSR